MCTFLSYQVVARRSSKIESCQDLYCNLQGENVMPELLTPYLTLLSKGTKLTAQSIPMHVESLASRTDQAPSLSGSTGVAEFPAATKPNIKPSVLKVQLLKTNVVL